MLNVLDYGTLLVLTCHVLTDMVQFKLSEGNDLKGSLKGNENCFELAGGSSY